VLGLIFCCLLAGAGIHWLLRGVARLLRGAAAQMAEVSYRVATTAETVGATSQSVSQAATEQASSIEETSTSAEGAYALTRETNARVGQAQLCTTEVEAQVVGANRSLQEMIGSMQAIRASSDKISGIIKVIDEIAFQTNILALNAAVEAARAGTAGAGFAVVADEVRNLAQRSAQAARDTTELIQSSIQLTLDGHKRLGLVTTAIEAISERMRSG
jgi:methyl-accepting chemotaxis protein